MVTKGERSKAEKSFIPEASTDSEHLFCEFSNVFEILSKRHTSHITFEEQDSCLTIHAIQNDKQGIK